jgi:branched-chain amino acid transport system permease protein
MTDFLQLFLSGLSTGSIYALVALGFTLLWQASGTINFAQGEFVMLPAFVMVLLLQAGASLPLAFVCALALACGVLGWLFKRGLVDPLLRHGMMPIVVATIGLSIALRNGVRAGYSAEPQPFPRSSPTGCSSSSASRCRPPTSAPSPARSRWCWPPRPFWPGP